MKLEGIPQGIRDTLGKMGFGIQSSADPSSAPESANEGLPPPSLRAMHKRATMLIIMLFVISIVSFVFVSKDIIFSDNALAGFGFAGLILALALWYFTKAFSTHKYPDKLVISRKGDPIWVYDEASWRGVFWPFYDWKVINGRIIDVDLVDQEFLVRYGSQSIKLTVDLFGSFQLDDRKAVEGKKPAILSYKLTDDQQRWDYFKTEMIDKASSVLGEFRSPDEIVAAQDKIEKTVKKLLSAQCKKVGYKVIDHNMKIEPIHIGVEADSIKVIGLARAEVANEYTAAINNSWHATALVLGGSFLDILKEILISGKKSEKTMMQKVDQIEETIKTATEKLSR